jgi:hypothetical protein
MASSESYQLFLGIVLIYIPVIPLITIVAMLCCIPLRKPVYDEETELERGMLVEVVRIHKDGKEIYSRDGVLSKKRLYDHPSFAMSKRRLPSDSISQKSTKSKKNTNIRELRSQLIEGMTEVSRKYFE